MNDTLIQRYQPGGDIYASVEQKYGTAGADDVANAALTGDYTAVTEALATLKDGTAVPEPSTASILASQLYNNPVGATAEQLGTILGNTSASINTGVKTALGGLVTSPGTLLLLGLAVIGVIFYVGGLSSIKKKFL